MDRYRRAARTTASLGVNQMLLVLTGLASIPLALQYLGKERFGIWMTIISTVHIVQFADLGLGNGLICRLSPLRNSTNWDEAKSLVSSALACLLVMSALIVAVFIGLSCLIDWADFFAASSPRARAETPTVMMVATILFAVDFCLNVVRATQKAFQEEYVNNWFRSAGAVVGLGLMVVTMQFGVGMPAVVGVFMAGPIASDMANGLHLYLRGHPQVRPSLRHVQWSVGKSIMSIGGWFVLMQASGAMMDALPRIALARTLGPAVVASYAIVEKVFLYLRFVVSAVVGPLWPAYAEAYACGDNIWMRRTLRRTLMGCLGTSLVACLVPVLAGEKGFEMLAGKELNISVMLLIGFAVFTFAYGSVQVHVSFLVGSNRVAAVALATAAQAVVLPAIIFPLVTTWGAEGAVAALLISLAVTRLWYFAYLSWTWKGQPGPIAKPAFACGAACFDATAEVADD